MASRAVARPARSHQKRRATAPKLTLVPTIPPSHEERYAAGKALRQRIPRSRHAEWSPQHHRRDPVEVVMASSRGRIPELLPIRYGRMMVSPFTFYRGTADIMAGDLASTPVTGLRSQLCGDCHLLNFNGYATPERRLIFDINDFDETLPGPWEWDVKRLAASFVMAARSNGFSAADQRDVALTCLRSYRERMAEFGEMPALNVWYACLDVGDAMTSLHDKTARGRLRKQIRKASRGVLEHDFPKMVTGKGKRYVIKDNPPLIYHHELLNLEDNRDNVSNGFALYRDTLPDDRKTLLDRFRTVDFALKVVGVGSVGTLCAVMLMMASNDDPLFLQLKEAGPSVLEPYVGKSVYANHGQRVVVGQHRMQAASDIFLGWTHGRRGRHFYVRQLHDMKIKPVVETFTRSMMTDYATLCGWTLARAHARSSDPARIAGYLGKSDAFDRAVTRFSVLYADQAERDHARFMQAIRRGQIEVYVER